MNSSLKSRHHGTFLDGHDSTSEIQMYCAVYWLVVLMVAMNQASTIACMVSSHHHHHHHQEKTGMYI
jgi:hypothetical protein